VITRRLLWPHPEWWAVALAAGAWLVIFAGAGVTEHRAHLAAPLGDAITHWTLMMVAAMVPTLIDPIREVAGRSFWHRRHRAVAVFLAGYMSIWILFGIVVTVLVAWLPIAGRRDLVPITLVIAAAWQLSPLKWRSVMACHRRIALAPSGWPATRDCLRQGWAIGWPCVVACGPMMAACALVHDVGLMAAIAAIGWFERAAFRPRPYAAAAALASLAAIAALPAR
jgi:predicted metal-binding membrane protein